MTPILRTALANSKGQMTIEMLLIMAIFLSASILLTQQARSRGMLAGLVEGPWSRVQGMIENGVWKPVAESKDVHPNGFGRHISVDGDIEPN